MSADRPEDKTGKNRPEADAEDDDRTVFFSPADIAAQTSPPGSEAKNAAEDDGDRTVFFSPGEVAAQTQPPQEQDGGGDEDRTVFFTGAPVTSPPTQETEDEDRTVFFTPGEEKTAPPSPGYVDDDGFGFSADGDEDRTLFATTPPAAAPPATTPPAVDDDDRTRVMTTPPAAGGADDDDDRTRVLTTPPSAGGIQDDDRTVITQRTANRRSTTFTENHRPHPAGAATPLSSLEPGTVINNMYRVEERLDQGGMGRVFRGVEIGTGEAVAIKVILPEMAEDEKVAQMFRREARTLRQLHHDAIVRYFAYVPPDERMNLHALVMGFIQGIKLSDRLADDGPLSQRQVVQLTMRLADGLERAHQIGIIHRDLSPDNVMLPDGDIKKSVLIDFGISRSSTVKDGTIGNEFAGKLKYVSPEQLGLFYGEAEEPSDVYSLALLMIAMLTGKPLPMGSSIADAVQKRQGLPDLSGVPLEFRDILSKMLVPDPRERMQSMQAVMDALSEFDGGTTGFSGRTMRGGTRAPVPDRAVPGLQALPAALRGGSEDETTDLAAKSALAENAQKKRGLGFPLFLVAMIALGGGGYYFALPYLERVFAPPAAPAEPGFPPERVADTRATFLAGAVPDACSYAPRRTEGASAGVIEAFGTQPAALRGLGATYAAEFGGGQPDVVTRLLTEAHCPVASLAHMFHGTAGSPVEITLASHVIRARDTINGTIHNSDGRANYLALINPEGRVVPLSPVKGVMQDPIGSQRLFSVPFNSRTPPGTYTLIATASESALTRAGAIENGDQSADVLPLLARELARDGAGAVDMAYFQITN